MKSKILFETILKSLKIRSPFYTYMDLNEQALEDADVFLLIEALKDNSNIQSIDLSCNPKLTEKSLISMMHCLSVLPGLSILRLQNLQLTEGILAALGATMQACKTLQILDLSDNPITEVGLKSLKEGIKHNNKLRALYLSNCGLNVAAKALAPFLLACPLSLQTLVLAQNKLNSKVAAWLQPALSRFTDLRELDISQNKELGSAGAEAIAEAITDLPNLKVLNLNQVALQGGLEAFFTALRKHPGLHTLTLVGNQLGQGDALILQKQLPQYPGLRQLNLGDNPLIEGDGSVRFADALVKLPYLQDLNLSDTDCTINLHSLMLQLRQVRQLTRLDISHQKLGYSMGLIQLGALLQALPHCPNLRWLNLSFTVPRKEAGIAIGQALANQAGLESLDLEGTPLGNQGVQELLVELKQHPTLQRLSLAKTALSSLPDFECFLTLKSLNLSKNELKEDGIPILCQLLEKTTTLQQLDLQGNAFGKTGFKNFIQNGLARNASLLTLNLSHSGLEVDSAILLKDVFIKHPTLQVVLLKDNSLPPFLVEEFEALNAEKQRVTRNLYYAIQGGSLINPKLLTEALPQHLCLESGIYQETLLHHAARRGGKETFKALLMLYQQHHLPLDIYNAAGQTARDIIIQLGHTELLPVLDELLKNPLQSKAFQIANKERESINLLNKLKHLAEKGLNKWINKEELDLYIPIKGAWHPSDRQGFDLETALMKFCQGEQKVALLLGASGSGKTLFLQYLALSLNKQYQTGLSLALYISLPSVSQKSFGNPEKFNLVEEALYQQGFNSEEIHYLKQNQTFILILDAFDEPRLEENLYISHRLGEWKGKVIISCRTDYLAQLPSYHSFFAPGEKGGTLQFNLLQEIYALPFSLEQIKDYVSKYLSVRVQQKETHHELLRWGKEWLEPTKYQEYMARIPGLASLIENPFLLRVAIEILPEIAQKFDRPTDKEAQRIVATGFKLYEIFLNHWFIRQRDKVIRSGKSIPLSPKDYLAFAKNLTSEMYNKGLSQVTYQEELDLKGNVIENEWSHFFSDKVLSTDKGDTEKEKKAFREKQIALRIGCPLRKLEIDAMNGVYQYTFLHMSLYEYFMADILYNMVAKLKVSTPPTALETPVETGPSLLSLAAIVASDNNNAPNPSLFRNAEEMNNPSAFTPFWQSLGKRKKTTAPIIEGTAMETIKKEKEEIEVPKNKILKKSGLRQ